MTPAWHAYYRVSEARFMRLEDGDVDVGRCQSTIQHRQSGLHGPAIVRRASRLEGAWRMMGGKARILDVSASATPCPASNRETALGTWRRAYKNELGWAMQTSLGCCGPRLLVSTYVRHTKATAHSPVA